MEPPILKPGSQSSLLKDKAVMQEWNSQRLLPTRGNPFLTTQPPAPKALSPMVVIVKRNPLIQKFQQINFIPIKMSKNFSRESSKWNSLYFMVKIQVNPHKWRLPLFTPLKRSPEPDLGSMTLTIRRLKKTGLIT